MFNSARFVVILVLLAILSLGVLISPIVYMKQVSDVDFAREDGLALGFNFSKPLKGNRATNPLTIALKGDSAHFEMSTLSSEVPLKLFFGYLSKPPSLNLRTGNSPLSIFLFVGTITKFDFNVNSSLGEFFATQNHAHLLLAMSPDEFWSEQYAVSQTRKRGKTFKHDGETISIPRIFFNEPSGSLKIRVGFYYHYRGADGYEVFSIISSDFDSECLSVRYSKNDNTIKLSK